MKGIRELAKDYGVKESELRKMFVDNGILTVNNNLNPELIRKGKAREEMVMVNHQTKSVRKKVYNEHFIFETLGGLILTTAKNKLVNN